MHVVVTGAAGYIGRHVVKELLVQGHKVVACDLHYKGVDEKAVFSDVPIFSRQKDIFHQLGKPDLVIHLAWRNGFVHNAPSHMEDLSDHIIFLKNLINEGCKNIAVMGSMHEIGYWEGAINEHTPCNPLSQYGVAKNALRQSLMLLNQQNDFHFHWLRAYYIYGDDLLGSSIFSKLLQAAQNGQRDFPFTSGKNEYDFISVYELARQIVAASTQNEITGIINVCSGRPVSLGTQVEQFIQDNQLNITLKYGAFPDRTYDSPRVWGDAGKITRILGLEQNKNDQ